LSAYEIKIKIELAPKAETDNKPMNNVLVSDDNEYSLSISEEEALNIDKCENAVMKTAYPAIRDALSTHLESLSKKKPRKKRKPDSK